MTWPWINYRLTYQPRSTKNQHPNLQHHLKDQSIQLDNMIPLYLLLEVHKYLTASCLTCWQIWPQSGHTHPCIVPDYLVGQQASVDLYTYNSRDNSTRLGCILYIIQSFTNESDKTWTKTVSKFVSQFILHLYDSTRLVFFLFVCLFFVILWKCNV